MKKKILLNLLIVLSLFLIVGCNGKKENTDNDDGLEENEYSVAVGKFIIINDDLSINLEKVTDSRCPEGVECYWQGELDYFILLNGENYELSTVLKPKIELNKYLITISSNKCDENTMVFKVERKY